MGVPWVHGFPRSDGSFGARNHLLVLPTVVCANGVVGAMGEEGGLTITHQHGCAQFGDDLSHTEATLRGVALNPNVGGVLVVSLGCETLRGRRLVEEISAAGREVEHIGIQQAGGTAEATAASRRAVARLREKMEGVERQRAASATIGVVGSDALADAVAARVAETGFTVLRSAGRVGPHAHTELAAGGAQVIVSLCGRGDLPCGSAVSPVINVGVDASLLAALPDEFDLAGTGPTGLVAATATELAVDAFDGATTTAERSGDHGFALGRLAVTM